MSIHSFSCPVPPPTSRPTVDLTLRQRLLWPFVRRYARAQLPRWGHLLNWFGLSDQPRWEGAPIVLSRGRYHGLRLRLDLADFFQRINYFAGAWHEMEVLAAIDHALRPGDAFVDGGANIGLVSLHGAPLVGPGGRIDSFECNPLIIPRLCWHKVENRLHQLHIHQCALGDRECTADLRLPGMHNAAAATLAPIPDRYGSVYTELGAARVVRGDDVLDPSDERPLLIKLDVEGYELKALRGMIMTIRTRRPAILTELNGELLAQSGDSPGAIFDILHPLGYEVFAPERTGFRTGHRLRLHPLLREELVCEKDVLWLIPHQTHWRRLAKTIQIRDGYWRHR